MDDETHWREEPRLSKSAPMGWLLRIVSIRKATLTSANHAEVDDSIDLDRLRLEGVPAALDCDVQSIEWRLTNKGKGELTIVTKDKQRVIDAFELENPDVHFAQVIAIVDKARVRVVGVDEEPG